MERPGCVAAQRGEPDQAFAWLERAFEQRDLGLSTLLTDPLLTPLHQDARYRLALERAGMLPFVDAVAREGQSP